MNSPEEKAEREGEDGWFATKQIEWIGPDLAQTGLERLNIPLPF
jgi:hypothetical protein